MRGPRCPRAAVGLLGVTAGVQGVPGLGPACWQVGWGLGLVAAHCWADSSPGISGCMALGF